MALAVWKRASRIGSSDTVGGLDENPQSMRIRRETVEHPSGTIKARMGATYVLMKRLKNVKTELALSVLAYNLTRAIRNLESCGPIRGRIAKNRLNLGNLKIALA